MPPVREHQATFAPMTKCPFSVIAISGLFIAAGSVGLAYHATEFRTVSPFPYESVWVCLVRLLAVVCGVFLLRGRNWARWGVILWLAYHVVLSAFHSALAVVVHTLLLAVIGYLLLRPRVSAYFRGVTALSMICLLAGCQQPPAARDLSLLSVDQLRKMTADPDLNAVTDHGMTPLQLPRSPGWDKVVAPLASNGAT